VFSNSVSDSLKVLKFKEYNFGRRPSEGGDSGSWSGPRLRRGVQLSEEREGSGGSGPRLRRGVRRREEGYHLYPGESLQGPSRITIQNKHFTEGRTVSLTPIYNVAQGGTSIAIFLTLLSLER